MAVDFHGFNLNGVLDTVKACNRADFDFYVYICFTTSSDLINVCFTTAEVVNYVSDYAAILHLFHGYRYSAITMQRLSDIAASTLQGFAASASPVWLAWFEAYYPGIK